MIKKLDETYFDIVYSIMEQAFPYCERRDKEAQKKLFQLPQHEVYGWIENDEIRAFLAVWNLGEIRFGEHLAVAKAYRNHGIGAQLFQAYEAMDQRPLVFEVELPETDLAKRRITFYERMGYHYYGHITYYQGAFHQGQKPLALRLMMNTENIDQAQIDHYIDLIYEQVYHTKRWF